MEHAEWDAVVVGGGFFGAYLALLLSENKNSVLLVEREQQLLERASYNNQARVHGGYHYPRSLITAVRSRINFPRFVQDFRECVVDDFPKYYAVGRALSKVTADQFRLFMNRVGAPLKPATAKVRRLFNADLIEDVFTAVEYAFDAARLRVLLQNQLAERRVQVLHGASAQKVWTDGTILKLRCDIQGAEHEFTARQIFNCTYSGINSLLHRSGLPLIPLKHEIAEMALVEPPPVLEGAAVTVMCGPFFSLMPFPDRGLWTLSHVRYTPHCSWSDTPGEPYRDSRDWKQNFDKRTNGPLMICDAARYLPTMMDCHQKDSLWEVKTVLPQNEVDDGRPILFYRHPELPGLVSIMGGKLDNVYDISSQLQKIGSPVTCLQNP